MPAFLSNDMSLRFKHLGCQILCIGTISIYIKLFFTLKLPLTFLVSLCFLLWVVQGKVCAWSVCLLGDGLCQAHQINTHTFMRAKFMCVCVCVCVCVCRLCVLFFVLKFNKEWISQWNAQLTVMYQLSDFCF